jgi:hypothetical protein
MLESTALRAASWAAMGAASAMSARLHDARAVLFLKELIEAI